MSLEQALQSLFAPESIQNPYPAHAKLRPYGDLLVVPELNSAFALSVDAVNAFFRHPSASANRIGEASPDWPGDGLLQPMMLFHDHASHARLRGLVSMAFTPKAVAETRQFIVELVDELLDRYALEGGDFMTKVAVPFPLQVIARLLGLQEAEQERFRAWADTLLALLDGSTYDPAKASKMSQDVADMRAYFREVADELRQGNRPGVLASMARAEADGERLSADELLANAALLLGAGFETTTNLIAGAVLEFSRHPQAWRQLLEDPSLAANAAEECLRFVTPVQATSRVLRNQAEWKGQTLPEGLNINLMLGAANRDPEKFSNPDRFNLTRPNAERHVAFASGPHYCLGAPLARLEAQIFLERLRQKFPHFSVPKQTLEYRHNFTVRGLKQLEVAMA
ncbi:MAG: cytochrome P450 [Meiothermus sp.]|nr:cytochrome P450 [Meiothermus sp.]